jgi:hypothetical protein
MKNEMVPLSEQELVVVIGGGDAIDSAGYGFAAGGLFGLFAGSSGGAALLLLTATGPIGLLALFTAIAGGAVWGAGVGGAAGGLIGFLGFDPNKTTGN